MRRVRRVLSRDDGAAVMFERMVKRMMSEAHEVLDEAGIPTTKLVSKRGGIGFQRVTLSLAERIRIMRALLPKVHIAAQAVTEKLNELVFTKKSK